MLSLFLFRSLLSWSPDIHRAMHSPSMLSQDALRRREHFDDVSKDGWQNVDSSDLPEFTPMKWSLDDVRRAIPPHLFERNGWTGVQYLLRDFVMVGMACLIASYIDPTFTSPNVVSCIGHLASEILRWSAWCVYWWFQGLIFTGIWAIGHECSHGALSASRLVCDTVGYIAHTMLWTPYFTWKISHHLHHIHHATMDGDDAYVPRTRSELSLPERIRHFDYEEYLGDTPIYTLTTLVLRQFFAYPIYLAFHYTGHKLHWQWADHRKAKTTPEFLNRQQVQAVALSNIGIATMVLLVQQAAARWGAGAVFKFYGVPWFLVSHWFMTITYLHHTDPRVPRYRRAQWSFARGAAATVDRDFLGWAGRFFLHGVAHYHVVHHFFPRLPFYHAEEATKYVKALLGEHYHYSDKNVLQALWENYNDCQFVEDDEDILFYRNKKGQAMMRPAPSLRQNAQDTQ